MYSSIPQKKSIGWAQYHVFPPCIHSTESLNSTFFVNQSHTGSPAPSLQRECDSWITSNQSKAECRQDCLRTALYLELGQDMAHMRLYCIFGHVQVLGNILIRLAQGKQVQYILFALSQGFRSLWRS